MRRRNLRGIPKAKTLLGKRLLNICIAISALFIFYILTLAVCGPFSPERSSHAKIALANGRSIYVNRLARGVSYDVMWITASSGSCRTPDREKDIVIGSGDDPLYYKPLTDRVIYLFNTGPSDIPKSFPVAVKQQTIHPIDWPNFEKRYESEGIKKLVLDLPKSDPCVFRWTEIRDLFRGAK
jgi:hypothetical protein